MSSAGAKQDSYTAAVAAQLLQTQSLIQNLLAELRENSTSVATLSAELKHLRINVQMLSNIIRGDDGNTKPLIMEVEVLKLANVHLDKRMTEVVKDFEDQVISLGRNISNVSSVLEEQRKEFEEKLNAEENRRREYETKEMEIRQRDRAQTLQLAQAENVDIRADSRQRFQTWVSVLLALISLIGTVVALAVK